MAENRITRVSPEYLAPEKTIKILGWTITTAKVKRVVRWVSILGLLGWAGWCIQNFFGLRSAVSMIASLLNLIAASVMIFIALWLFTASVKGKIWYRILGLVVLSIGAYKLNRAFPMPTSTTDRPPTAKEIAEEVAKLPLKPQVNERMHLPPEGLHTDADVKANVDKATSRTADVAMKFIMSGPQKSLSISFVNRSNFVVRDIHWAMILWNTRLNQPDSIPIHVYPIDWIKKHEETGRVAVFERAPSDVTNGDVLIGTAALDCPKCTSKSYVLDLVWGDRGWYGEVKRQANGPLLIPKDGLSAAGRDIYFKQVVTLVPQNHRVDMREP